MSEEQFEQWCIVELMGHVRLAGKVTEEEHFGAKMGRIDIPGPDGEFVTQFFGGGSVYRITPVTEDIARAIASRSPAPVSAWEMRALPPADRTEAHTHSVADTPGPDDDDDYDSDDDE